MSAEEIVAAIREAARAVYPPYHYDDIDAHIANAFERLADEIERLSVNAGES